MAADTRTHRDISRSALTVLRAELKGAKVDFPPGDEGTLSSHGLTGSFAFDPDAQTLQLSILEYPMFLPRSLVWKAIDDAIAKVRAANAS